MSGQQSAAQLYQGQPVSTSSVDVDEKAGLTAPPYVSHGFADIDVRRGFIQKVTRPTQPAPDHPQQGASRDSRGGSHGREARASSAFAEPLNRCRFTGSSRFSWRSPSVRAAGRQ